jgi:hypothetical protein
MLGKVVAPLLKFALWTAPKFALEQAWDFTRTVAWPVTRWVCSPQRSKPVKWAKWTGAGILGLNLMFGQVAQREGDTKRSAEAGMQYGMDPGDPRDIDPAALGQKVTSGFSGLFSGLSDVFNYRPRPSYRALPDLQHTGKAIDPAVIAEHTAFWQSKGYTCEQAAGIIANMHHESGGDPRAVGDGGRAVGLFQWHPNRRRNIENNTGINIDKGNTREQLEAAAWEMAHGGDAFFKDSEFRSLRSAEEAAAFFSLMFERPAAKEVAAAKRAGSAASIVGQCRSGMLGP